MLLHFLLIQQALSGSPPNVCEAIEGLVRLELAAGAECRLVGEWLPATRPGDLPYDRLAVPGVSAGATAALRSGLDTFVRVATPLAEMNTRGGVRSALSSFAEAVERDPALYEAAIAAAELALRTRHESDMRFALAVARRTRGAPRPLVALIAELEVALGQSAPALSTDPDLLRDPAYRRVEAIARLQSEDRDDWPTGDSLYFSALRDGGEPVLARAVTDLGPLAEGRQPRDARAIEEFWSRAAAEAGVSRPRRLREHFGRLRHAYAAFYDWPRIATRGQSYENASLFDRRGSVWIRHGAPLRVVHTEPHPFKLPSVFYQTWIYEGAWGEPFLVHFEGANRTWTTTLSLGCDHPAWLYDRAELDPRLGQLYLYCHNPSEENHAAAGPRRAEVDRDIREVHVEALTTQSVDTGLRIILSARLSSHRLEDEAGRPELLLTPGIAINTPAAGEAGPFRLEAATFVAGPAGTMETSDTIAGNTGAVAAPGYASIPFVLPAPAAGAVVRVVLRDIDSTHVGAGMSTTVPPPLSSADGEWMSDLVTLSVDGPATLIRYGRPLSPTPDVVGGARFGLYFELYGLEAEEYRATIRARRSDAGVLDRLLNRDEVLSLSLTRRPNIVRPGTAAEKLIVAAPDWEPGEYELVVEIEADGERITRNRMLHIVVNE